MLEIEEEEIIGSQTEDEESKGVQDDDTDEVLSLFGIEKEEESEEKTDPPTDQEAEEKKEEKKGITVKYNKEDTFIEEDKIPEYARKGLNYDKVESRAKELQDSLDRAAKLHGYKDHADYVANFDKIEQEQQQKQQQVMDDRIAKLRQDAEDAGLDPDQVQEYLDNLPIVKEAAQIKQDRETERLARAQEDTAKEVQQKWEALYAKYPDLVETSSAFDKGEMPEWFNADMKSRIERGYDPTDAYELAHRDKLTAQTKQKTEQRIIKETQLGLRSKVETSSPADNETPVPADLANAFKAFGMTEAEAKKYLKK